jgi:hypothetical protein
MVKKFEFDEYASNINKDFYNPRKFLEEIIEQDKAKYVASQASNRIVTFQFAHPFRATPPSRRRI